jgi:hypothetical protein
MDMPRAAIAPQIANLRTFRAGIGYPTQLRHAEKPKTLSFRGTLRAEESLFSRVQIEERFLASLGMTKWGRASENHKATTSIP